MSEPGKGRGWVWPSGLVGCNSGIEKGALVGAWTPICTSVLLSEPWSSLRTPLEGRPTALVAPEGSSLLWSWEGRSCLGAGNLRAALPNPFFLYWASRHARARDAVRTKTSSNPH